MKIDLNSIDRTNFIVAEHEFHGEKVFLVIPQHIGCSWDSENLIFRSSVWNADGEPVNLCHKKFFNWGEHPELTPLPKSLNNVRLIEKLDGSLLGVSSYKGNIMCRTRGTIDARRMEKNGFEIDYLLEKYPKVSQFLNENPNITILFEWLSPLNVICIKYDEADIRLIGAINHSDYSYWTQDELDSLSLVIGVLRPLNFHFDTIEEMISSIESLNGKEGIVIYFGENQQQMLKLKSIDYLKKHRFKSQATLENTLDLYFSFDQPSYQEFEKQLTEVFDYECFEMVRGFISQICDAAKEVENITQGMTHFVEGLQGIKSRKDCAMKIISSYGQGNSRASMCFALLDGKSLTDEQMTKLFWQVLKK